MPFFLDTEFYEHKKGVDLISLAVIDSNNGDYFYAENLDFKWPPFTHDVNMSFLKRCVYPKLDYEKHGLSYKDMSTNLLLWFSNRKSGNVWAYFGTYDWFLFCRLLGGFNKIPMSIRRRRFYEIDDITTYATHRIPNDNEHHALSDAQWNRRVWEEQAVGDRILC